ncbi:ADP-ribosylation factor-like [Lingula anatina]|uniref:ADP-ribosylation factor-like n=1 Tax=Lingula anatina TaxID=7574 RepID=A0A1S3I7L6_LINAN|nr:ADP-ribosylation factor-like [Lingula anatina]|eukprot:XP_013394265.1 ADP-ribosylation factor-like [Lingula anatina]
MGFLLSKLAEALQGFEMFKDDPAKILMLGLDAAGKTTILYRVKLSDSITTLPTIGFNVETVSPCKGLTFTVWDVGGQEKFRHLWKHYYQNTQGLIYVVDSSDRERLDEAREELFGIMESPEMKGVPVVVIANKQDLPGALSTAQMIESLQLRMLPRENKWHVQAACAPTAQGLYEALDEMARLVKKFRNHNRAYSAGKNR